MDTCGVAVGQLPLILLLILFLLSSPFSHRLLRSDNVPAALARSPWPPRPLWPRCKCPSARGCAVGAPLWGWPRPEPAPSARWEVWRERRGREARLRVGLTGRRGFRWARALWAGPSLWPAGLDGGRSSLWAAGVPGLGGDCYLEVEPAGLLGQVGTRRTFLSSQRFVNAPISSLSRWTNQLCQDGPISSL